MADNMYIIREQGEFFDAKELSDDEKKLLKDRQESEKESD